MVLVSLPPERMPSYEEQIAAVEAKQEELTKREAELAKERNRLWDELENLKSLQLAANGGLPEEEVNSLKMALTIVGKAISSEDVVFGGLWLLDEEPEETEGGYQKKQKHTFSIHIECGFVEDCAVGLRYEVKIKTKEEAVRAIVRSMITSTEYITEEYRSEPRYRWGIDWDYHDKIILKNPYSKEEYYKKIKY
jgi:hypothetical protein